MHSVRPMDTTDHGATAPMGTRATRIESAKDQSAPATTTVLPPWPVVTRDASTLATVLHPRSAPSSVTVPRAGAPLVTPVTHTSPVCWSRWMLNRNAEWTETVLADWLASMASAGIRASRRNLA